MHHNIIHVSTLTENSLRKNDMLTRDYLKQKTSVHNAPHIILHVSAKRTENGLRGNDMSTQPSQAGAAINRDLGDKLR